MLSLELKRWADGLGSNPALCTLGLDGLGRLTFPRVSPAGGILEGCFLSFNPPLLVFTFKWLWWSWKTSFVSFWPLCFGSISFSGCSGPVRLHFWAFWPVHGTFICLRRHGYLGRLFLCSFWPSVTEACEHDTLWSFEWSFVMYFPFGGRCGTERTRCLWHESLSMLGHATRGAWSGLDPGTCMEAGFIVNSCPFFGCHCFWTRHDCIRSSVVVSCLQRVCFLLWQSPRVRCVLTSWIIPIWAGPSIACVQRRYSLHSWHHLWMGLPGRVVGPCLAYPLAQSSCKISSQPPLSISQISCWMSLVQGPRHDHF